MNYTEAHIRDIIACMDDVELFASRHVKVPSHTATIDNITPSSSQQYIWRCQKEKRHVAVDGERQAGVTLAGLVSALHTMVFENDKTVVLLSTRHSSAVDLLDRLKFMFFHLPEHLQIGVSINNKTQFSLVNGCTVYATSNINSLRGRSINLLLADNIGFRDDFEELMLNYWPAMVQPSSKALLLSTGVPTNNEYAEFIKRIDHDEVQQWKLVRAYRPDDYFKHR